MEDILNKNIDLCNGDAFNVVVPKTVTSSFITGSTPTPIKTHIYH